MFYGWWIVAANAVITFWVAGTFFYSFGAFINPLKNAFGWSTAQIALAFSIRSAEAGPIAPVAGYFVDRFGARAVTIFGVPVTELGFFLLSRINSLAAFYSAYMVIALGTSLCLTITPMTNIANWFIKKRGRALGLFAVGAGLGGLMVPLVTWLLDLYGWRITLVIIAIGTWLVCLPLALILRHRPEKYNLLPDGEETCPELRRRARNDRQIREFKYSHPRGEPPESMPTNQGNTLRSEQQFSTL
jgi:MFS family permease